MGPNCAFTESWISTNNQLTFNLIQAFRLPKCVKACRGCRRKHYRNWNRMQYPRTVRLCTDDRVKTYGSTYQRRMIGRYGLHHFSRSSDSITDFVEFVLCSSHPVRREDRMRRDETRRAVPCRAGRGMLQIMPTHVLSSSAVMVGERVRNN